MFAISKRWPLARPHHRAPRIAASVAFDAVLRRMGHAVVKSCDSCSCGSLRQTHCRRRCRTAWRSSWQQVGLEWLSWIFITLPFGVAVYLCVVGIEHATRYFVEAREREVQVARLSEQLSSARFAALQAQLNPHFLFNTLNTIAVLVRDNDRQGAVRIVEH